MPIASASVGSADDRRPRVRPDQLTFPGGGAYHGSKHAVEALSDALRFEVRGFGVDVVVIEPGLIKAPAVNSIAEGTSAEGPYAEFNAQVAAATAGVYEGVGLARLGGGPTTVARKIERALTVRRPRTRYRVTPSAHLTIAQRRLVSDRVWDAIMRSRLPTPRV